MTPKPDSHAASGPFAEEVPCAHPECDYIDGRGMVCVECGEIVPVKTSGGKPKGSRPIRSAATTLRPMDTPDPGREPSPEEFDGVEGDEYLAAYTAWRERWEPWMRERMERGYV